MKDKVITKNTAEFFRHLIVSKMPFFTVKDAETFMESSSKAYIKEFLQQLVERQLALRLKKGLYVMLPYDTMTDDFLPNRHLAASILVGDRDYYIGYYTALQLHDLTTQPALTEQVVVDRQVIPGEQLVMDVKYQFVYHNEKHFFGARKLWVEFINQSYPIKYSDLEKTIIDCLFKPQYAGGIVEIAKAIYQVKDKLKYTKLLTYLKQMGSQAVIKRLGFLLELFEVDFPIAQEMLNLKSPSYVALDPIHPKRGKTQSRWSIQINVDLETIKQAPFS